MSADHDFARAVTWRLAAIEARPPRPGDAALLVALAEEATRDGEV